MKGLIINFCPTGMVPTKAMTPHVPVTNEEIANDVFHAAELGANMAHIHIRDADEKPHYSRELYGDLISRIRSRYSDLILCVSCSGRDFTEFEHRSDVLNLTGDLRPDMASLTLSSLNFARQASLNAPDMVHSLAEAMGEKGIKPELEVFDLGMMNYAHYLINKGVLQPPYYFNIILGNVASAQATPSHLAALISEMPDNSFWCLGGIGGQQLDAMGLAMIYADGVRIGLEDNIWFDAGRKELATNEALVRRVMDLAAIYERYPILREDLRLQLGISPLGSQFKATLPKASQYANGDSTPTY